MNCKTPSNATGETETCMQNKQTECVMQRQLHKTSRKKFQVRFSTFRLLALRCARCAFKRYIPVVALLGG